MKKLIKKILAWVLKDDLKKLRGKISDLENQVREMRGGKMSRLAVDHRLEAFKKEVSAHINQTTTLPLIAVVKWGGDYELLRRKYAQAIEEYDVAFLNHKETTQGKSFVFQEIPPNVLASLERLRETLINEESLRKDLLTMSYAVPEPTASEMRREAQSLIIDFENPQI
jgi:hypothetical protein